MISGAFVSPPGKNEQERSNQSREDVEVFCNCVFYLIAHLTCDKAAWRIDNATCNRAVKPHLAFGSLV